MRTPIVVLLLGTLLVAPGLVSPAHAESPDRTSASSAAGSGGGKGRWIGLAIGAGAGFAAGVVLGLHKFDDAINSDRKVWTTAILMSAAGGAAGYFIGRRAGRRGRDTSPAFSGAPLTLRAPAADEALIREVARNWGADLPRQAGSSALTRGSIATSTGIAGRMLAPTVQ